MDEVTGIRVHISPGARASCPRRRDAGGTPALPGCHLRLTRSSTRRRWDARVPTGRPRSHGTPALPARASCPRRHDAGGDARAPRGRSRSARASSPRRRDAGGDARAPRGRSRSARASSPRRHDAGGDARAPRTPALSEGIFPSETRRGRGRPHTQGTPALSEGIFPSETRRGRGRPRTQGTPAHPRDARAPSEGIFPSETRRGRGRPRTQGTLTLSEGIFPSETRRGRGRPRTQGVTPGVNGYSVSTSAGATTIISSKSRKSSPLNVNRCVTSWASIAATSRAS